MSTVLIDVVDVPEGKNHIVRVLLWPKLWQRYSGTHAWTKIPLNKSNLIKIPEYSGIYFIMLDPNYSAYMDCSYLMYIGETSNFRTRFKQYLSSEKMEYGRPQMYRLLNNYDSYLHFCYTPVPFTKRTRVKVEDDLIDAYIPPFNKKIKGRHGVIVRDIFS